VQFQAQHSHVIRADGQAESEKKYLIALFISDIRNTLNNTYSLNLYFTCLSHHRFATISAGLLNSSGFDRFASYTLSRNFPDITSW
jgi:hypothetical protein